MDLSPDTQIMFYLGPIPINATIFFTWIVMAVLAGTSALITSGLHIQKPPTRWRSALETIVAIIRQQIADIAPGDPGRYLPFVGTLFLFIAGSNLLLVVPGFRPPTASLSTTAALALCVLAAVPAFGISQRGLRRYLANYLQPTLLMLPFNIIGEFSRILALAVRLYGNVMSGAVIAAILLGVAPFFFPVAMDLLGLLTGMIQAYIFAILAMVYIAAAVGAQDNEPSGKGDKA